MNTYRVLADNNQCRRCSNGAPSVVARSVRIAQSRSRADPRTEMDGMDGPKRSDAMIPWMSCI
jgi:hypothetical protein